MKEDEKLVTIQEFFELKLDIEESIISSEDLVAYLRNMEKMFKSINNVLNTKAATGYDLIEIDVLALEKGSFRIPICINKKTVETILVGVVINVIGELVVSAINSITSQTEPKKQNIETQYILEDRDSLESIKQIAHLALGNKSIKALDITYEEGGQKTSVNITREDIKTLADIDVADDIEEQGQLLKNERLEIVSPVFVDEPSKWKVKLHGKIIGATVIDRDFLDTMLQSEISFAKGDAIVADVEILERKGQYRKTYVYQIVKVNSYPRYSRILKHTP